MACSVTNKRARESQDCLDSPSCRVSDLHQIASLKELAVRESTIQEFSSQTSQCSGSMDLAGEATTEQEEDD